MNKSDKLAELATKVNNDISEGIDCGESKKQLRDCIKWWADAYCSQQREYVDVKDMLLKTNILGCFRLAPAKFDEITAQWEKQVEKNLQFFKIENEKWEKFKS